MVFGLGVLNNLGATSPAPRLFFAPRLFLLNLSAVRADIPPLGNFRAQS